jgi:hypothetical protein
MSDTTVRLPTGVADGVAAYVREVRGELADLPVEDVDDLTGGMEADLSEFAAESGGDLVGRLGSPSVYAAELRAAAGLPERVAGSGRQRGSLGGVAARSRASFARLTGAHPWLRSATAYLVTLRPAWWLVRGYLAAWALWAMLGGARGILPHSFPELVLALAAVVVSVQLGRGWLGQWGGLRPLLVVGNSALVLVAFVALVSVDEVRYGQTSDVSQPAGVSLDGEQVGNIFTYDSEGRRITGVRLFAQDGRPLGGGDGSYDQNGNPIGVVRDGSGAPVTNAYPRALFGPDPWQVVDPADTQMTEGAWTPPMSIVPLAPSVTPTPGATATATGRPTTPAPSASTPPAPSSTTRPAPSSGPSPSVARSGR